MASRSSAAYAANKADLARAQKSYQSKLKFGKSDTRQGGLTQAQIGEAPTMKFSSGVQGTFERQLDYDARGLTSMDRMKEENERKRQSFGFGGGATQLG